MTFFHRHVNPASLIFVLSALVLASLLQTAPGLPSESPLASALASDELRPMPPRLADEPSRMPLPLDLRDPFNKQRERLPEPVEGGVELRPFPARSSSEAMRMRLHVPELRDPFTLPHAAVDPQPMMKMAPLQELRDPFNR